MRKNQLKIKTQHALENFPSEKLKRDQVAKKKFNSFRIKTLERNVDQLFENLALRDVK